MDRLLASCHILSVPVPFSHEEICQAVKKTLLANGLEEGYIRPLVYLGTGEMGLFARSNPVHLAIAVWPWGSYLGEEGLKKGIRAKVSSFSR